MKSCVLLLALLQSLGCSGIPQYYSELESMGDRGFRAAVAQINSVYAVSHLYRATQGQVKKVIPVGPNTVDLLMKFNIKETECTKASGSDLQTCAFKPGFFVPSFSCSSRVRMSATSTQVVSVTCGHDSSSSSESSEEIFSRGRHTFKSTSPANGVPTPFETPSPPPVQHSQSPHSETAGVRPRGDTFSNLLELRFYPLYF